MLATFSIILLISTIGLLGLTCLYTFTNAKEKEMEMNKEMNKKIRSEEELMSIVFNVLERKWQYRVQFHFKLKEIKVPKFEFEWNYLLKETMDSISPDVMEELKYYYKDDETVIKAVSELIQIYLYNYMEQKSIKR